MKLRNKMIKFNRRFLEEETFRKIVYINHFHKCLHQILQAVKTYLFKVL